MSAPKSLPAAGDALSEGSRDLLNDLRSAKAWSPLDSRHVYFDRRGLFVRIVPKSDVHKLVDEGFIQVQRKGRLHLYQRSSAAAPKPH